MDFIKLEFLEDFLRITTDIEDVYCSKNTVGIVEVLKAHYLIVDFFDREYGEGVGGVGPRDIGLLHSTVGRQFSGFSGKVKWEHNLDICATLFWGLIKNHPFHDANKRTAFLTLLFHLWKIKRIPNTRQKYFEELAIRVASNRLSDYPEYSKNKSLHDPEVKFISKLLRKYTKELDRRQYIITFGDLNSVLAKHGFFLDNPDGNKVDVLTEVTVSTGFLREKKTTERRRVGTLGFPGWSKQVSKEDLKKLRQMTELTPEFGYDSEAFYNNADPLMALIPQYQTLLRRLSDR